MVTWVTAITLCQLTQEMDEGLNQDVLTACTKGVTAAQHREDCVSLLSYLQVLVGLAPANHRQEAVTLGLAKKAQKYD